MKKLESHYKKEDGIYLIEIKLREIRNLFNSLDPAPFLEKDLDDEAEKYIIDAVDEFPLNTPLKLIIYLPLEIAESEDAHTIPESIRNYFEYRSQHAKKNLEFALKQGRISLLIGLTFLFFCISTREAISALALGTAGEILAEGLLISGWVAMWRPIQIYLYDWWPIQRLRRIFEKIQHMDIEVRSMNAR